MLIGFVGDVHGRVFHALAALATWQERTGRRFDLLIQVGDMGAYPDATRMDEATHRYLAIDPSEGDFGRMLAAKGTLRADFLNTL